VIRLLCEQEDEDCIAIADIRDIINSKWNNFGKPRFIRYCLANIVTTILITFIVCLINFTPNTAQGLDYRNDYTLVTNLLYLVTTGILFFIALDELLVFLNCGLDYWGLIGGVNAVRGAARFDKVCRTIIMMSYTALCSFKSYQHVDTDFSPTEADVDQGRPFNSQDFVGVKLSAAICVMSTYIYAYYFLMGFDTTGPFVLILSRIVGKNIPFFLMFYAISLIGFACSIALLTNNGDPNINYGIFHTLSVSWYLVKQTVSVKNFNEMNAYDTDSTPEDFYCAQQKVHGSNSGSWKVE
jgi:hypothetical protein